MINYKLELEPVEQRLNSLSNVIDQFGDQDLPEGLTLWQTDDMKRKYPNLEQPDNKTALTRIWPTSRLQIWKLMRQGRPVVVTGRPILRRELYDKLRERMQLLMEEQITWR